MAYTTEEKIEPFWAQYSNISKGRDPLAIQNSSTVIYRKMVPGITNTTNRIRYNGFFCWIFDTIAKNIDKKNSLQEQIRYSRRAELLLAYLMVKNYDGVTGVSGGTYARQNLSASINLIKGADLESKKLNGQNLYWKNENGVFGSYFSGVTRELGLINHPNPQVKLNIYSLTEKGKNLAEEFEKNIPKNARNLYWKSVQSGKIKEVDLVKLKPFAVHLIPDGSQEKNIYQNSLLDADSTSLESTYGRSDTIKLLLDYLAKTNGDDNLVYSFLRANYNKNQSQITLTESSSTAWYLYEANEIIHVAFEHFHSCFLYLIESYPTLLEDNIESLVEETIEAMRSDRNLDEVHTLNQFIDIIKSDAEDVHSVYQKMETSFRQGEFGLCIKYAIETILHLYVDCEKHIEFMKAYASVPQHTFNRSGYVVELMEDLVISHRESNLKDYVKAIIIKTINLHTYSSYNKTKIGQSLVSNYLIEDHYVWRLRDTYPNRTAPRLQNVIQYVIDIGWIKKEGKIYSITEAGKKIIRNEE